MLLVAFVLLSHGGSRYRSGFRCALDCLPFVVALCALMAARRGVGPLWKAVIALVKLGVAAKPYGVSRNYHP